MDFNLMNWEKQKNDSSLARAIRSDTRLHRRERGRGGHRFHFSALKGLWSVENIHAVLNHKDDPAWLYFYNHPQQGWILVDWRMTRREAQALAELPQEYQVLYAEQAVEKSQVPGWHVHAGEKEHETSIDVSCRSEEIADDIREVFQEIGFWAVKGHVMESLPHIFMS
jgi:hypothetical protein